MRSRRLGLKSMAQIHPCGETDAGCLGQGSKIGLVKNSGSASSGLLIRPQASGEAPRDDRLLPRTKQLPPVLDPPVSDPLGACAPRHGSAPHAPPVERTVRVREAPSPRRPPRDRSTRHGSSGQRGTCRPCSRRGRRGPSQGGVWGKRGEVVWPLVWGVVGFVYAFARDGRVLSCRRRFKGRPGFM